MSNLKGSIITGLFFLCFSGIVTAQNIESSLEENIRNKVDSVFQEMLEAAGNLDIAALKNGVDDSYHAGFITNGTYYADFENLMENFENRIQGLSRQQFNINEKRITVLSEKLVLLSTHGDVSASLSNGQIINSNFFWSFVFEKTDNGWKVIQSHQSAQ